ncbi:MAG: hypothetical protein A2044_05410 [Candidatus Firestonebacteria bacterium GWA2_43_8]|nr:MAG: hypothetical protein A2044_05410 [Candidatus Firestonebacteria bacterium GWA2_43_8]
MAFDGRYKYCYSESGGIEELYDLKKDKNELRNLSKNRSCKNKLKSMRTYVIEWCKKNRDSNMLDNKGKLKISKIDVKYFRKAPEKVLGWRKY